VGPDGADDLNLVKWRLKQVGATADSYDVKVMMNGTLDTKRGVD
jgi:hypothetical protein